MAPKTDAPLEVAPGEVRSLSSVLGSRASDLSGISGGISSQTLFAQKDLNGGQSTLQRIWSQAVSALSDDLWMAVSKIDGAVAVYEKNDQTVGISMDPPPQPRSVGGRRPE
ncbi:MAG TPA: hypothetical protein VHC49_07290 [Mycobacteriales bacterium]|nr:hypothetical protein [Mycobacteriales bacterium]